MTSFKKLIFPFKLFIQELKGDYAFQKTLENKKMKAVMLGAMGQICILLIGLVFMYYNAIYITDGIIYTIIKSTFHPITLIGIPFIFLMIWAWTSFGKKYLLKIREHI